MAKQDQGAGMSGMGNGMPGMPGMQGMGNAAGMMNPIGNAAGSHFGSGMNQPPMGGGSMSQNKPMSMFAHGPSADILAKLFGQAHGQPFGNGGFNPPGMEQNQGYKFGQPPMGTGPANTISGMGSPMNGTAPTMPGTMSLGASMNKFGGY